MKKIITLIILLANFIGNAQCPAPSNIAVIDNIALLNSAELSWTENGNATVWDLAVIPGFNVGTALPSIPWVAGATNNPFILTNIPSGYGCYAFFVRSVCSTTAVSPWIAIASSGCSTNVSNYLSTLSNNSFSIDDDNNIKIFPNPSKNIVQIKSNSKIDKITLFDSLGKTILIQTQNNNEVNVEKLSKGLYLIEFFIEGEKKYKKFIKE